MTVFNVNYSWVLRISKLSRCSRLMLMVVRMLSCLINGLILILWTGIWVVTHSYATVTWNGWPNTFRWGLHWRRLRPGVKNPNVTHVNAYHNCCQKSSNAEEWKSCAPNMPTSVWWTPSVRTAVSATELLSTVPDVILKTYLLMFRHLPQNCKFNKN